MYKLLHLRIMFFQCINIIVSWIVRYKVYQYHDIRVFYISLSILYIALLYCYSLYMRIRCNSLNYMYDNCVHCSLCCAVSVLCVVLCVVFCILCSVSVFSCMCCIYLCLFVSVSVCVRIVWKLCAYCVRIVCKLLCCCLCAYICLQVYDWLCVYLVRMFLCVCVCGVRLLRLPASNPIPPLWLPMRV